MAGMCQLGPVGRSPRLSIAGLDWSVKRHRLRFCVGGRLLVEAATPAAFLEAPVETITASPAVLVGAIAAMPSYIEAAILPSVPVTDATLPQVAGAIVSCPSRHEHYMVDFTPGEAAYRARWNRKHRHELDRKKRRFAEATGNNHAFRVARTPSEVEAFLSGIARLAETTWQARLLHLQLETGKESRARYLEVAREGRARAYELDIDGRPVAFGWCDAAGDRLRYRFTGYDPEFSALSPGVILLDRMISDMFEDGSYRILDLGYGDAQYKREFANLSLHCASYFAFRDNYRNRALLAAYHYSNAVSDWMARCVDRAGLKTRLRQALRR